jgi:NAD(P)-dependent dehydrogenase (short-subunit alcohol dehydrogenase family)
MIRSPMTRALAGKLVLVTGAYGGLGREVSLACARAGATVVMAGRIVRRLEALYDEIVGAGGPQPIIHPLDLAKAELADFEAAAQALTQQYGRLDALVHVAATLGRIAPIEHQTLDGWLHTYRVNAASAAALTRACSPLLRASPAASVIFTLDSRGQEPRAYWGEYAASKAALGALFRELVDEWQNLVNVRVEAVVPGPMNSPMRRRSHPAEDPTQHPPPQRIAGLYLELLVSATSGRARAGDALIDAREWLARE